MNVNKLVNESCCLMNFTATFTAVLINSEFFLTFLLLLQYAYTFKLRYTRLSNVEHFAPWSIKTLYFILENNSMFLGGRVHFSYRYRKC